jgi:DNA replication protein DnaC
VTATDPRPLRERLADPELGRRWNAGRQIDTAAPAPPAEPDPEHLAAADKARRAAITRQLDGITPRRYLSAATDNQAVTAWSDRVLGEQEPQSLLVLGPTSVGKTHLAYAALYALGARVYQAIYQAINTADLYARLRPRPGGDPEATLTEYAGADVLLLDDLGVAKPSEWTEEVTYRLLNHRYEQLLPTVVTSNLPVPKLRDVLGERVASRLAEMAATVVLDGPDRRRRPS